jgi:L-fuconolactonase
MAAMAESGKYTSARGAAGIVAFADLALGERTARNAGGAPDAANGRLRGIRQRAKWDPDPSVRGPVRAGRGLYLEPEFRRGLALLTKMGLSFDASIFHPQLPDVSGAGARPPRRKHRGHSFRQPGRLRLLCGQGERGPRQWLAGMKELARCPNVTIKMGGLLMCLGNFDFTAKAPADSWPRPH